MKKLFAFLPVIILIQSCNSGDEKVYKEYEEPKAVKEKQTEVVMPINTEETNTLPAPGSGTVSSDTNTPIVKENVAIYRDNNGNEITALYSFDNMKQGIVHIIEKGVDTVILHQYGDAWGKGAEYSNGKYTWTAYSNTAMYETNGDVRELNLYKVSM